jgi:hypothetical protein
MRFIITYHPNLLTLLKVLNQNRHLLGTIPMDLPNPRVPKSLLIGETLAIQPKSNPK